MFKRLAEVDQLVRREIRPRLMPSALGDKSSDEEHETPKFSCFGTTGHFKGDIVLEENLRIEGEVEGTITVKGKQVRVGERAVVKGEIHATNIEVLGTVEGDLYGDELIRVHAKAEINGSIYCKRIVVEDGARFNGLFQTSKGTTKTSDSKKVLKPVGSKATLKSVDKPAEVESISA